MLENETIETFLLKLYLIIIYSTYY